MRCSLANLLNVKDKDEILSLQTKDQIIYKGKMISLPSYFLQLRYRAKQQ